MKGSFLLIIFRLTLLSSFPQHQIDATLTDDPIDIWTKVNDGTIHRRDTSSQSAQCGQTKLSFPTTRIVGGTEARPHSIPWIASLRTRGGKHFCGGTLIRVGSKDESDIVVTAAHCLDGVPYTMLDVVLGAHYISKEEPGEMKVRPARNGLFKHSEYNKPVRLANDIAIIKLAEPVRFSDTIRPICLPGLNEQIPENTSAIVAGWGHIRQGAGKPSDTLQLVQVPIIGSDLCSKNYGTRLYPETMLCAGYPKGGKDACQNDSGGPFFIQGENGYVLHGIVSFGDGCARAGAPGIYTRVSTFANWIQERIQELSSVKD